MPITIPMNDLPGSLQDSAQRLIVRKNYMRQTCVGHSRMSLDEIFLDLMMAEGFLFHANDGFAIIIKDLHKYVNGDILVTETSIFRKRHETSQTVLDLIMLPQVRENLLPIVKSTIILREFKGTAILDGLKLFIDICYICNCLLIGEAMVFISHMRLCHNKLSDNTNICLNFNTHRNNNTRGLDLCIYNTNTDAKNVFTKWGYYQHDAPGNRRNPSHNARGKTEHGCLFCEMQYDGMKSSDVEMLRNDWCDDSRHYTTHAFMYADSTRKSRYSSYRPIVVGHMMKHLEKIVEDCKTGISPFIYVWAYANEVYENNTHNREKEKLNANKQKE